MAKQSKQAANECVIGEQSLRQSDPLKPNPSSLPYTTTIIYQSHGPGVQCSARFHNKTTALEGSKR